MTWKASTESTSLPESPDGISPSNSPDGETDLFGQPLAPAPRSPSLANQRSAHSAKERALCGALDDLHTQFARTAVTNGPPTSVTYGRKFGDSHPSHSLQSSLENKLRAKMEGFGCPLFVHRWKFWDMQLGLRICRLAASARSTDDNDCFGWPTVTAAEISEDPQQVLERKERARERHGASKGPGVALHLGSAVRLTHWPTVLANKQTPQQRDDFTPNLANVAKSTAGWPTVVAKDDNKTPEAHLAMKERMGGNRTSITSLQVLAKTTGWTTPQAHDAGANPNPERLDRHGSKHGCKNLVDEAGLAAWPSPTSSTGGAEPEGKTGRKLVTIASWATVTARDGKSEYGSAEVMEKYQNRPGGKPLSRQTLGTTLRGLNAETDESGQSPKLNPEFCRWLMGFPVGWGKCAGTGTR